MKSPKKSRKAPKPDPVTLAREAVDEWFVQIASTTVGDSGREYSATIEVDEIVDAIRASEEFSSMFADMKKYPDDLRALELVFAQRAGYLVGVQVGLRLRRDGGAR